MDQILDGLFISNYRVAKDEDQLNRNSITHIVRLMLFARPTTTNHHYLCVRVTDSNRTNIAQYFAVCNDFIHKARSENVKSNNVLLHCYMGLSRSVAVAIAYLMTVTDLGFDDAWRVVRSLRMGARPNLFFQKQLHEFEINQLMLERYRLRKCFPNSSLYIADRLKCRSVLRDYNLLLLERLRFNIDNHKVIENTSCNEREDNETEEDYNRSSFINLTIEQKRQLQNIIQNARAKRRLVRASMGSNLDMFEKKILMPGAILFTVLKDTNQRQGKSIQKSA